MKRKLFFDMDNTLVNFQSGIDSLDADARKKYEGHYDDAPDIFSKMEPVNGAVAAVQELSKYYDCYILSTSPWANPTALDQKLQWIKDNFDHTVNESFCDGDKTDNGNPFYKKVIFSHHKEFLNDGDSILIDDRPKHGADTFDNNWLQFNSGQYPDWDSVVKKLVALASAEK